MSRFLWMIYVQPLNRILYCIVLLIAVWSIAGVEANQKKWWKLFNVAILLCSFAVIVFMTVYSRETGTHEAILKPFQSFIEAQEQPELYRSMLMNVFLFVPIGLSLPIVLPRKRHFAVNVCLTILFGCALSAAIEWCQYRYGLGRCEVDDVIMNTLGTAIGASSDAAARLLERRFNHLL